MTKMATTACEPDTGLPPTDEPPIVGDDVPEIELPTLPTTGRAGRPRKATIDDVDCHAPAELVRMLELAGGDITLFFKDNFKVADADQNKLLSRIYFNLTDPLNKEHLQKWERLLLAFKQSKFHLAERTGLDALASIPAPKESDKLQDHIKYAEFWLQDLQQLQRARVKQPAGDVSSLENALIAKLQAMIDGMAANAMPEEAPPVVTPMAAAVLSIAQETFDD